MASTTNLSASKSRMQELLAQLRAAKLADVPAAVTNETIITQTPLVPNTITSTDKYGNLISLNEKQSEFVRLVGSGQSAVLIGPAGTGKTTSQKEGVRAIISNGHAGILQSEGHKYLPPSGAPGIVIVAYTRRAVANIRRNMPEDLKDNCITIHKLLEYQPVYYEYQDSSTGEAKKKMVFEATRTQNNPLPSSIRAIVFEEASMLGTDLYNEVIAACPHKPIEIFLGDIQQLPPVFGPAILGFKLLSLPVVELTEVYRQALESPILSLAHRVLSGVPIPAADILAKKFDVPGKLKIAPWMKKIAAETALDTVAMVFNNLQAVGKYDPEEDMILIPYNKSFGTDELNKNIANSLARKNGRMTYEISAGFERMYLSPGDKVLFDKEDAIVVSIESNPAYTGAPVLPGSVTLDYWGYDSATAAGKTKEQIEEEHSQDSIDFMLNAVANADSEDRVRQASHIITLKMQDSGIELKLDKASQLNTLILGYALTVHKAQGSEWNRVFFLMHQSNNAMVSRELIYTALTRAKEELIIMCEPDHFDKGIRSQRVKGDTLAEKAEFFKGKQKERQGELL